MAFDAELGEPGRAAEIGEIDDEGGADHLGLELAQQLDRSLGRAAGGDQIVDQQHRLAGRDGILVHLDHVDAVFELVVLADCLAGSLPFLRIGTKPQRKRSATAPPRMKPRASMPTTDRDPAIR